MFKVIDGIGNLARAVGLFGITASLALGLAAAPVASAAAGSARAGLQPTPTPSNAGKLVVTVYDAARGTVIAGASVAVFDENGRTVGFAVTPATGTVAFKLPFGNYKVLAKADAFDPSESATRVIPGQTARTKALLHPKSAVPLPFGW